MSDETKEAMRDNGWSHEVELIESLQAKTKLQAERIEELEAERSGRTLLRIQPCGCVVCCCDDYEQCHGCGAKMCAKPDCVFKEPGLPRAEYNVPNPYIVEVEANNAKLKQENATLRATAVLVESVDAAVREGAVFRWDPDAGVWVTSGGIAHDTLLEALGAGGETT
jgi:uncharacterized protein (DUF2147 family)